MKYAIIVLTVCALLATSWGLAKLRYDITDQQRRQQEVEREDKATACQTRYKRLMKTKRLMIPVPVYNVNACEDELDTCVDALAAIKLWCDPTCKQQLSECLDALQLLKEYQVSYYP